MPATKSCGGAARGSPDFSVNGAPGVNKARVCVKEGQRDMGNPPRAPAASGLLGDAVAMAEAGLCGGARRCAAFRPEQGLRSTTYSAKRTRGTR
jgi:hypothetical protein